MLNLNRAQILGNLTKDPEMRYTPNGQAVANFSVATNRKWKNNDGTDGEATDYHEIVVWGKQAENVVPMLKKGQPAFIEGRLQTRSWDDKATNTKKYRTEVIVENFQFGPSSSGQGGGTYTPSQTEGGPKSASSKADKIDTIDYPTEEINPEDIPF